MFIMKQKSPAPSRSSLLPALPLVLGPDSLALDCVLRASFLLLEVRTGTGVAGASVSSTVGVVFFFMKPLLRFRRRLALASIRGRPF